MYTHLDNHTNYHDNDNYANLTAKDLYGALYTTNADPCLIEYDEVAQEALNCLRTHDIEELTPEDGEEYELACLRLDLTPGNAKRILLMREWAGEEYGYICLASDWE